ncbi:taurine catabolism dioxygenase [Fusarium oxysporum f. sp. phaseoli]
MHGLSRLTRFGTLGLTYHRHFIRSHGTLQHSLRVLDAPHISWARDPGHVYEVVAELQTSGLLKIRLGFPDDSCDYLRDLILSMHKQQGHRLPIAHSATRGWFWDVRPKPAAHTGAHHARSETMSEFSWHTDCSYEDPLPRYFALQVLQHDRYGGGTLSAMNVASLIEFLSSETRKALMAPEFRMKIPPEFNKDPKKSFITGSILAPDPHSTIIRYRGDIVTPLTTRAEQALEELRAVLVRREVQAHSAMHLRSSDLPKGSILLMDNRRWMHARNEINDPERHLRRVRWDARPFNISNHDS